MEQNNLKYNDDVGDLSPVHRSSSMCGGGFRSAPTSVFIVLFCCMRLGVVCRAYRDKGAADSKSTYKTAEHDHKIEGKNKII